MLNKSIQIDEEYDDISFDKNVKLYKFLLNKMHENIYEKMFDTVALNVCNGQDDFEKIGIEEQCTVLMNLLSVFKTGRGQGCNLELIGGKKKSAEFTLSSKISNWGKKYSDVRIINESASGIYRQESDNILEWL